jgi:hypothetical protein
MKKFKQYLEELFNKPLQYQELSWHERDTKAFVFQTENQDYYRVFFRKIGKEQSYEIYFDLVEYQEDLYDPDAGTNVASSGSTDSKNSLNVFSTVSSIVRHFISKNKNISKLFFATSDTRRGRKILYDRLSKKLSSELNWTHRTEKAEDGQTTIFYIEKKKK